MTPLAGGFVKSPFLYLRIIGFRTGLINIMMDDSPYPGIVFVHKGCEYLNGHRLGMSRSGLRTKE
jgi:hypothetical protein